MGRKRIIFTGNLIDFSVGHGRSDGERAQVSNFSCYVMDVFKHIDQVTAVHSGIPVFMFGHSMVGRCTVMHFFLEFCRTVDNN